MKKEGKSNYLKAGAHRPISISSYVGKLLERIIEQRIMSHCNSDGLLDDEQEGFRSSRNTTRYLYKLIANLKEAQQKKFTAFLLCIDFEKAFDSVWLKGLTVKLYNLGIRGRMLHLINSFLFTRKVKLTVNDHVGEERHCGGYGVPQGSVLSPLLFILFIRDMFDFYNSPLSISTLCIENSSIFKYADDGSVLVIHEDPIVCNRLAQECCNHISQWCSKWRLIVNCDRDKTECLIIKPSHNMHKFTSMVELQINGKTVNFASSTKVLGLHIDDELSFNLHSGKVLQRSWHAWFKITRNTTRHWGLNISTLVILFRTIVLTKLLYAAPVWLNERNCLNFKDFYAKVCHKISGATHYSPQAITLLAMGLEPLIILYKLTCVKFVLKALTSDINMMGIIYQLEESRSHPYYQHIIMVKDYISLLQGTPVNTNHRRNYSSSQLAIINKAHLRYNQSDITKLRTHLWNNYITSEADRKSQIIMSHSGIKETDICTIQSLEHHKILFPRTSKRATDTKVMTLLHGHDLSFNTFKYSLQLSSDPFCSLCIAEKDNSMHRLLYCPKFNCHFRCHLTTLSASSHLAHAVLLHGNTTQLNNFRCMAQIIFK